jgi:hypothetical protein
MKEVKEAVEVICLTVAALAFMYFIYKMANIDN